jgi:hypothetical protein
MASIPASAGAANEVRSRKIAEKSFVCRAKRGCGLLLALRIVGFGPRQLLRMDNRLVHGRARRAEMGEFGIGAIAAKNVDGRYRPGGNPVRYRPLDDGPIDTARRAGIGRIGYVLEAAIDRLIDGIETALGLPVETVAVPLLAMMPGAARPLVASAFATCAGVAVSRGVPAISFPPWSALLRPRRSRRGVRPALADTGCDGWGCGSERGDRRTSWCAASPAAPALAGLIARRCRVRHRSRRPTLQFRRSPLLRIYRCHGTRLARRRRLRRRGSRHALQRCAWRWLAPPAAPAAALARLIARRRKRRRRSGRRPALCPGRFARCPLVRCRCAGLLPRRRRRLLLWSAAFDLRHGPDPLQSRSSDVTMTASPFKRRCIRCGWIWRCAQNPARGRDPCDDCRRLRRSASSNRRRPDARRRSRRRRYRARARRRE